MSDCFVTLKYNVKTNKFETDTNCNKDGLAEILENFLRSEIGKGKDERKRNILDEYTITLNLDLSSDTFHITDNCGNDSLRCGIVQYYFTTECK